jgi:cytochrome c oxidase subunit 2
VIDTRHQFDGLWTLYLSVLGTVFVVVSGAIVLAVIRFRARGPAPDRGPDRRPARWGREGAIAVAIVAIVAVLLGATFRTESRVDEVARRPGVVVDVTAYRWGWRFAYRGTRVATAAGPFTRPVLVVPVSTTIRVNVTSRDVIHAFWVPAERFKRDAFPNRVSSFDLAFPTLGDRAGRCAEYCGLHHADMGFVVRVVSRTDFRHLLAAGAAR